MTNPHQSLLPIKILLCGLGWWGINWLSNIRSNKNYLLVGVVDKKVDILASAQKKCDIDEKLCFSDIKKAILATNPDALAVVVSPDKHGEIIQIALANKIHILSEKPLAKDLVEAKE